MIYSDVTMKENEIITSKNMINHLIRDLISIFDLRVEFSELSQRKVMFERKELSTTKALIELLNKIGERT